MCANCLSTAEATLAWAGAAGYVLRPKVHRMLANAGLAPKPDPVAHDVRTVAFLRALDLDPVEVLGADVVAQSASWEPDTSWTPWRERRVASARPSASHPLIAAR